MLYTADGMDIGRGAVVDHVGAMYHGSRGTARPGFSIADTTVVLRFDPLALTVFGTGLSVLPWQ
jgi:hypothetical protein